MIQKRSRRQNNLRLALFDLLSLNGGEPDPFFNLPESGKGRWGDSLDTAKMKEGRWVKPDTKVRIAFVEWTDAKKLRHARFMGLRC